MGQLDWATGCQALNLNLTKWAVGHRVVGFEVGLGPLHPRRPRGSQSEVGEMARQKFSRTGGRTPGYQVSPDHFQTALRIPAPDWAEKIPCIILPNRRAATLESLSCVLHGDCCPAIFI